MMQRASDKIDDARWTVADTVRGNPIPAAMIGLGLGWLLLNRRNQHEGTQASRFRGVGYGGYDSRVQTGSDQSANIERQEGAGQSAIGTIQEKAHRVQEVMEGAAERVQGSARQLTDRAEAMANRTREEAHFVEERIQRSFLDNPIAFGALSLAAGAAIGTLLPGTRREAELMGESRDRIIQAASEKASEAIRKVEDSAKEAKDRVAAQMDYTGQSH